MSRRTEYLKTVETSKKWILESISYNTAYKPENIIVDIMYVAFKFGFDISSSENAMSELRTEGYHFVYLGEYRYCYIGKGDVVNLSDKEAIILKRAMRDTYLENILSLEGFVKDEFLRRDLDELIGILRNA